MKVPQRRNTVRKKGPQSNNIYTVKSINKMQNKLNSTERHRYNVVHPNDGLCPQTNFPVLLFQSRKMKGYALQQNHCTSSSCSHSLSSSTIQCPHPVQYSTHIQYHTILNTIQYTYPVQLQWSLLKPYKGLITCNTMGQYHGLQQTMFPNHVLYLTTFDSISSQG